ncbi:hypothetical protein F0562_010975 [Nyssa sinensis]|uniref:Uncharacterized protein n=1 Tax=Nyssa sinensis TaxID=561372 RepID=A0A5J5A411_9ASTE|nr:hypothetical protein F0562_010975 [Nyssa sinensis]
MEALHLLSQVQPCSLTHSLQRDLPQAQRTWHKRWQIQCSSANQLQVSQPPAERRSANYQPTIWSHDFLNSIKNDDEDEVNMERAKKLVEEARIMIGDEDAKPLTIIELIDDIQRLGLGYHFEKDISKALDRIMSLKGSNVRAEKNVHATALRFRLLRQHGYAVSHDVFKNFKDQNGHFLACLHNDVKGLLSLYEASYLAFGGENLLDDAKAFTTTHLKNIKGNIDTSLAEQVNHAIELPLHHRMLRLEARWFIDAYSKREDANHLLLELAILDFNMVQSTLRRDLQDMSKWWKGIGLAGKLSFVRDRLMECFFWGVGMVFEPQFSNCRKGLTKVTALITTIDDIYDVYGSLEELELFTEAVQRWEIDAVKTLPDYMKLSFLALYNTVNEMAYETLKEQGVDIIPHLAKAWTDLCNTFLVEAKWRYTKYTPTLDAYLENGWQSVSGVLILVHTYFLMNQNITKEALEGLDKHHDLLRCSSMIFRLSNDLGTSSAEWERGETANSIICYMNDTGLSEENAREYIRGLIDENWNKMNKERVANSTFSETFIETVMNLARIAQCTYQYGDGHGAPDKRSKNRISSLIIEPIKVMKAKTGKTLLMGVHK